MRKIISIILVAVFITVFMVGCGSTATTTKPATDSADNTATDTPATTEPAKAQNDGQTPCNMSSDPEVAAKYVSSMAELTAVYGNPADLKSKIAQKFGSKKPVVYITSISLVNEFLRNVAKNALETVQNAGCEVHQVDAATDETQAVNDIENAISAKADAIIVDGGGYVSSLQETFKKGKEAGIPIIGVDLPSRYVATNITSDNYSGAIQVCMKMAMDMGGEGNIVVFKQDGYHSDDIRRWMLDEILKEYPDIKIYKELPIDGVDSLGSCLTGMESVIEQMQNNGDKVKAVFAVWGLPALGVSQALTKANIKDIGVYTADTDYALIKEIADGGNIKCTMGQSTKLIGYTAGICALKAIVGEGNELPSTVFVQHCIITKENANDVGPDICTEWGSDDAKK